MEGCAWRFVEWGDLGEKIRDGSSTSLPIFRFRNSGENLHAAIIHYDDNKFSVKMSSEHALRALPDRLIKVPDLGSMAIPSLIQ
jgi:hypothetical protein